MEIPTQIVPGSETAKKLAGAPAADTKSIDAATATNEPIDPAQMEAGKAAYMICAACHGQEGEGTPAGPPLAGSEWVTGPVSNLILIQMRGLTGPITVAGKEYTFPAGMFPLGLPDKDIADVLTYIRNSFGNKASAVKVEQVTPLRGEVGKPQLTAAELTKP
ncbi:MAG: cytochrome c [Verrucomicrobiaceae bacterium]|nr:MAG: cytochrome c [Verrucomicrobiaceae bacterium]